MKRSIITIIFLVVITFASCSGDPGVTLESMGNALTEAGYEVSDFDAAFLALENHIENITGCFIFYCPDETEERGWTAAFSVLEFKNNSSARKFINAFDSDEIRQWFPRNGNFVAGPLIDLTKNITQDFLEKLVNGEPLPRAE